jgi:membrane-bound serine protease (ClpP class)
MSELGIVLLLIGAALAVTEAHVPTHGALGAGAAAAAATGIALIAAGAGLALGAAIAAGLAAGAVGAAYVWLVVHKALAARRRTVRGGTQGLVGRLGEVRAVPAPVGQVYLDGALWRAQLWIGDEDPGLQRGDPIVVEHVDGLTLTIRRAEDWELVP